MRFAPVLVTFAACTPGGGPRAPEPPAQLQLIGCAPALPLPRTPTEIEIGVASTLTSELFDELDSPFSPPRSRSVPSVGGGAPIIAGSLDKSIVLGVIKQNMVPLRGCYERELVLSPGASGKVTVTFTVTPDGKVASTRAMTVGVSPALSACVVRVVQQFRFPTGTTFTVTYPFTFSNTGEPGLAPKEALPALRAKSPWTPFAIAEAAPDVEAARKVARATEGTIRGKLGELAGCFTAPGPTGSLRAMLAVGGEGTVGAVRTGGLGDAAHEACVTRQLLALHVLSPVHEAAEVACDFARGDARPWRLAPEAGYAVIEAGTRELRHAGDTLTPQPLEPPPLPGEQTFLVIAQPETPGALIDLAIGWGRQGDAILVAMRSGREPPVLVGAARTDHQLGGTEAVQARPALVLDRARIVGCFDERKQVPVTAALEKPAKVDELLRGLAARCRSVRCGSLGLAIDPDARTADLVDITAAARRAGFDRVLLGTPAVCVRR